VTGDTSASADVAGRQLALVSDQWHAIWSRLVQQREAVNEALGVWHRHQMQLTGLRSLLTHTDEVISANCVHDVVSLPTQRRQMMRLQV